jgi:hypothetical protein
MSDYCPEIISKNSGETLDLQNYDDCMPDLKHIELGNVKRTIDFRVLACIHVKPVECDKYSNDKAKSKLCSKDQKTFFAHIYCKPRIDAEHHLVVFVKEDSNPVPGFFRMRLEKTIEWLGIDEPVFFHIIKYGPVVSGMSVYPQANYYDDLKGCLGKSCEPKIYDVKRGIDYSIALSSSNPIILEIN